MKPADYTGLPPIWWYTFSLSLGLWAVHNLFYYGVI